MKIAEEIKAELKTMYIGMAIINIIVFLISLFWGFSFSMLIGLITGYIYMCWNLFHLGYTISKSIYKSQKQAKRYIQTNYLFRYFILVIIAGITFKVDFISSLGFLLPLFYPKIVLGFNVLRGRR